MALGVLDWLNLTAAAFLTALGVFLLVRRGRNRVTTSMAAFVLGLAGLYVVRVAVRLSGPTDAHLLSLVPYTAATVGVLGLAWFIGGRFAASGSKLAFIVMATATAISVTFQFFIRSDTSGQVLATEGARLFFDLVQVALNFCFYLSGFLLPWRALARAMDPQTSRALALVAVGISLFGSGTAAAWAGQDDVPLVSALVTLATCAALGLAWLRPGTHPKARLGTVTGLTILAVWAASSIAESQSPGSAFPVGRVLGTLLLLYAVLHGEIPGIDAKVRFGISKSFVAAVFIGVFFAASEVAQQFFGQRTGNEYYGIAAAGLLVVAIAPIQRLADRVAKKAVPSAHLDETSAHALYRKQAKLVWADGNITRKERRLLQQLRDHLNLPPHDAERIEDEEGAAS